MKFLIFTFKEIAIDKTYSVMEISFEKAIPDDVGGFKLISPKILNIKNLNKIHWIEQIGNDPALFRHVRQGLKGSMIYNIEDLSVSSWCLNNFSYATKNEADLFLECME